MGVRLRCVVLLWLGCVLRIALPSCIGQAGITQDGEVLEPMATAFTDIDEIAEYRMKLRYLLLRKAPSDSSLEFVELPSFDPECVLAISMKGTDYQGLTLRPDQNLWYDKRPAKEVVVARHEKKVPTEVAKQAISLWQAMLARTQYQRHKDMPFDGVSYVFLAWEPSFGMRVGEANNPRKGTKGLLLAMIAKLLRKFVEAPVAEEAAVLQDLGKAMDKLEAMLKETGQPKTNARAGK